MNEDKKGRGFFSPRMLVSCFQDYTSTATFHGNPPSSFHDILPKKTNVNLMLALEEKTGIKVIRIHHL